MPGTCQELFGTKEASWASRVFGDHGDVRVRPLEGQREILEDFEDRGLMREARYVGQLHTRRA